MKYGDNNMKAINEVIIENFRDILKRIPMPRDIYVRIINLLDTAIKQCGTTIVADALYTNNSNPDSYGDYVSEDYEFSDDELVEVESTSDWTDWFEKV